MNEERQQGEFNSAVEYLRRISQAFELCNEGCTNMNSYLWVQGLVIAFKELSTRMKPEEANNRMAELKGLLDIAGKIRQKTSRNNIEAQLYWRLFNFELFLRKVFSESGLEMKLKEDAKNILFKGGY